MGAGAILEEAHDLSFRPAAIVANWFCKKAAVSAMLGLDEADVRVGSQSSAGLGQQVDKGIVVRVNDQGGHADVSDQWRSAARM